MTRAARQAVEAEGPRVTAPLGAGRPLPAGWRRVRLGDVCEITARQVDPRMPEFGKLPHVNGENVESGTCRLAGVKTAAEDGLISGKYLFEPGDVLYSKLRPYLRKVVVAEFRGVCSADMYPIRVKLDVDPRFLAWTLLSRDFTEYADRESRRARMPKLNRDQLFSWTCSLPPINEQRRTAAQLGERMAAVERARAAAAAQLEAAKALHASYLQEVFDGSTAPGWSRVRVEELCESIDYGHTASADFTLSAPRFLRITDIQDGEVDWTRVPGCRISPDVESANSLTDGDIVFARTGATTGKSFLIRKPPRAVFASYLIRLRPSQAVRPAYLYAFFQSDDYWRQVRASTRGGAQPNVNATLLGAITVPLAPLAEQDRVVSLMNERREEVERVRKATGVQLAAINAMPAALLRQAFSGAL